MCTGPQGRPPDGAPIYCEAVMQLATKPSLVLYVLHKKRKGVDRLV